MHLISPEEFARRVARTQAQFAGGVTWLEYSILVGLGRMALLREEHRPDGTVKHYGAAA